MTIPKVKAKFKITEVRKLRKRGQFQSLSPPPICM